MSFQSINVKDLANRIQHDRNFLLLDVRTPAEYSAVHVDGAKNLPSDRITVEAVKGFVKTDTDKIYVVCQSGGRSRKACQQLADYGMTVVNVEGGTTACVAAGIPVIRGQGVIGIDRQVRIAAGSLVLLGVCLGLWVHWAGFGLSAFVGAGLVFAGATDTCGMAMILAAMPWNKSKSTCTQ
jgi:rhodanese-related sulfurtransferase